MVQAAEYIMVSGNLSDYLELFRSHTKTLLQERQTQTISDYHLSVHTAWQISFSKLSHVATTLLQLCAFMHHDGISEAIFKNAAAAKLDAPNIATADFLQHFLDAQGNWDHFLFLNVAKELQSCSLVDFEATDRVISIHPLVHTWCRTTITECEPTRAITQFLLGMSIKWDFQPDDYAFRRSLLPHIDNALQGGNDDALWNNMAMTPDIYAKLALVYKESGFWNASEKLDIAVMETRKKSLGGEHPDTLQSMANLAATYRSQGQWKEAEMMEVQVMEKRKELLGEEHPDTLSNMANLATTYWNQGQWKEAEMLQVQVMEKTKQLLGEDHPDTLRSMVNLAVTYGGQGQWKEAEMLQVQVMEKIKQLLGEEHPDTLTSMANLAATYGDRSQWEKAEVLEVQVMEKRKQLLGEDHPDTLRSMANLAATYRNQGQWKKAEILEMQMMKMQ